MKMEEVHQLAGTEVGVTEWFPITQDRIDVFAAATDDAQWIHCDPVRAEAESPYGTTIAHGFLTLSMISYLSRNVLTLDNVRLRINYGLNKVRFPNAVRAGAKVRGRFVLEQVNDIARGIETVFGVTIEVEGSTKPCCVAEWIVRQYR
ncbi:MAG: dehydratase [Bryobacterales bacterium]|jgi:acyl dehydratase|nr:dehydratase [Bryobacterales bacterium]